MSSDTQSVALAPPSASRTIAPAWFPVAIVLALGAGGASYVVARGTVFSPAHRAAAAWTGLLVVAALAVLAHAILLAYQARTGEPSAGSAMVRFRRRGLKAAVMGQDGRASTSKTQVAVWTAAVLWALVNLFLLARSYPGGNLFAHAMATNWRPEYLVLLGLPVAAATTAKAVVTSANSGRGPMPSHEEAKQRGMDGPAYVRPPAKDVKGILAGVAELLTGDDGTVAWADLQYVALTLITLANFVVQFLARPADGLPPVPAALLTLIGVSAGAYTANKIVNTKGTPAP